MVKNNSAYKIILGFVVIIIGLALIGTIATQTLAVTDKTKVYSEVIDISADKTVSGACPQGVNGTHAFALANSPTGWKVTDCPITSFTMVNQTDVAVTVTTDYVIFSNNGTLILKNTTVWGNCVASANDTKISYTYCEDGYLLSSWNRSVLNLVVGFFALALLGVGVGIFYSIGKEAGIV